MGKRPRGQRRFGLAESLLLGLPALALPGAARAADVPFAIPEQPRETALLALARQAGLALGLAPDPRRSRRAGLTRPRSVDRALDRLLAGSACRALRPDARTIVIRAGPEAPPSPATR